MSELDEICAMLVSPDPEVRDQIGYTRLVRYVREGQADGSLRILGDRMAEQFGHPETQARTFAPLGLVWAILRDEVTGELDAADMLRWRDAFAHWYANENDLRGWDDQLGWLHAIAHGSDAIEAFARSMYLDRDALIGLLTLVRKRLLTPTRYLFAHGEDDRLSNAVTTVLCRPELTVEDATGWLQPILIAFTEGTPGPVPPAISNTIRTLNSLYVANDRGIRFFVHPGQDVLGPRRPQHHAAIAEAIAACLRDPLPYLG